MKIVAIVPAAGSGSRLGFKTAKPYIKLGDKPLLAYALLALQKTKLINSIVIVAEKKNIKQAQRLVKRFNITKAVKVVAGGRIRSESVKNGLCFLSGDTDFVVIHDGARPFISTKNIEDCIQAAIKSKAAICAVRCVSTIKSVDKHLNVVATLDRNKLWQIQTPQVFSYTLMKKAYDALTDLKNGFFDDASLIEQLPYKVKIVPGSYLNIKITTKDDLIIAKAILKFAICNM
ncbi:MAG: 2-C-methyl-D-erythritol 4-phosphate cytidylyltransferase [Candidatus Omnitrophota bacterium]